MVLSIDQKKIDEQLAATPKTYLVTPLNLEMMPIAVPGDIAIGVYSTVSVLPADAERSRARLLALRQRLIQRGVQPLAADDLDRYIDDTRGR
jgi:hypothetical protein